MNNKLAAVISWVCLPIYIWQGLSLRRRALRLAPPQPQLVAPKNGTGKTISLLLIGDSSAAGVGVDDINHSLGGQLAKLLAEQTSRPTKIRIAGCNSATAGQLRDYVVPNIKRQDFTHIILNVGTNDAKNFHTGRRFCREFGTLIYALKTRFPDAQLIWSSILDMSHIPSLPTPLNKILGIRSRELRSHGEILCRERMAQIPEGVWDPSVENFSRDGFHASEKGYREWADVLVTHIRKNL
ncbi:MAG: SGNH/GDSL hydrolase family protein [Rhizobiaceae bacterium]|nr:SGNH/GDSL hydrolase family protein [Rhizobiaceae bacterium]